MLINMAHTFVAIPSDMPSNRIRKEKILIMGYRAFLAIVVLL